MAHVLRRASLAAAAGGGAWCTYRYQTDEGVRRAVQLYSYIGPVVGLYRAVELKHALMKPPEADAEAEWRSMDKKYAARVVRTLEDLQGMYTKYGQIASGMNNTFSAPWIEELRKLEDRVPPRPPDVVRRTIEGATGKPLADTFSSFEEEPLGSASIGQVHRATLACDGSEVAVKVQYPEAKEFFRNDMATIKGFFKAVKATEHLVTLGELERQFELEFDYRQEARNLMEVGANMRRHGFAPREVVVPLPRMELCAEKLLVMQLVPGCKLLDGLRKYGAVVAAREGKTLEQFETEQRRRIETEGVPARYDGPSAAQIGKYLRLLRLRDGLLNVMAFGYVPHPHPSSPPSPPAAARAPTPRRYNSTVGWALGRLAYRSTEMPPNAPRLMDTLMRVHGVQATHAPAAPVGDTVLTCVRCAPQLLVDGVFNADTHAGNFLMMPDDRIALIDYGATKRLEEGERLTACCLYAALARGDTEMLYNLALAGGYVSPATRRGDHKLASEVVVKLMRFGNDTMGRDLMGARRPPGRSPRLLGASHPVARSAGELNAAQFMDELKRLDPYEEVADNLVMVGFMSFRMRVVGLALNHPVVCSDWWGEIGERELARAGMPYHTWDIDRMRSLNEGHLRMATTEVRH
jgi:aarF domain-containing kinase